MDWQPISTAPKDGRWVILLSVPSEASDGVDVTPVPPSPFIGRWDPEGTSWVTEHGRLSYEDADHLEVTGFWACGHGWLQPNDVTHWMPLPAPPAS